MSEPAPEPPPSYELIVAERGMDGEIKRMILRPLVEKEAARAVPVSLREAR